MTNRQTIARHIALLTELGQQRAEREERAVARALDEAYQVPVDPADETNCESCQ